MKYTQEQLLEAKTTHYWSDADKERFESFLIEYKDFLDSATEGWSIYDLASAVAIFADAQQAFWFIEEGQDFVQLVELLATYELSNLKEGQTTLAQHLVEEHTHYFKVKNGYVFFAG